MKYFLDVVNIKSVIVTSCAEKPAKSNAAAISIWPLMPCSRSIAILGFFVLVIVFFFTGRNDFGLRPTSQKIISSEQKTAPARQRSALAPYF